MLGCLCASEKKNVRCPSQKEGCHEPKNATAGHTERQTTPAYMTENNNSTSFRSGSISAARRKLIIGRQSVGPNNAFLRGVYNYEKEKAQLLATQSEFATEAFHMIISAKVEHLLEGSVFERVKSTSKNSAFWFMRLKKDLQEIEYKELSEQQHQEFNIKAPLQGVETGKVGAHQEEVVGVRSGGTQCFRLHAKPRSTTACTYTI